MSKPPRHFFAPLATGAPAPLRELPAKLERMVHFVPSHLEKVRAKAPEMAAQVDVLLANLEDAIPADAKEAARAGAIEMGKALIGADVGYWSRVNALNSPWHLDDVTALVEGLGDRLDVIMVPRSRGVGYSFMDQLLALLEARHGLSKPIRSTPFSKPRRAWQCGSDRGRLPRMHGVCLGPADLAASRKMKTTRVGGAIRAIGAGIPRRPRAGVQQDLWPHLRQNDRCVSAGVDVRPVRRHHGQCGLRAAIPQRLPDCRAGLTLHPGQIVIAKGVQSRPRRGALRCAS